MDSSSNDIDLIPFGSNNFKESVINAIATVGVKITAINPKYWLEEQFYNRSHAIVLALEKNDYPNNEILEVISRSASVPHMAILAGPINQSLSEIIELCTEYCIWPCKLQELEFRLKRLKAIITQQNSRIEEKADNNWTSMNLVGCSAPFKKILSIIKNCAICNAPVLVEGETGTGKEVVARAIHYLGERHQYPFIPVNCGALPDHLVENELFGHEKGAYTDAKQNQQGLIAQAEGGTLFLDEIEALSFKGQVTLLRFIEDHVIRPLGAKQTRAIDVRIIAASNMLLSDLVAKGLFRRDLLFRLNLISIYLPPLRERALDIQRLSEFFMRKFRKQYLQPDKYIDPKIMNHMLKYSWPGNVRELENFIHRAFLLSGDSRISQIEGLMHCEPNQSHVGHVEDSTSEGFDESFNDAKTRAINEFEQHYLTGLISFTKGNVTKAAAAAKKERRAFGKLLKKHRIDPSLYKNN